MTDKEKREYLEQYRTAQNRITGLSREMEKWQTIGTKVNNAIGAGGSGSNVKNSKVETAAVNVGDILHKIQIEINTALEVRDMVLDAINQRSKRLRHREILKLYFINGMNVLEIAKILKKSNKTISNAISVAIKELDI